ncbi:MAG: T9SS type A sorting domain-containing protein [Bacteroidia bacterium]
MQLLKYIKHFVFCGFIFTSISSSAQVSGDFCSVNDGNWNDTNTWQRYNGSTWDAPGTGSNNPAQTPGAANSVWIQTATPHGNIVNLTQNESCLDLNICANTGSSGTSSTNQGIINLQLSSLNINGKLRCYCGGTGTFPGTSSVSGYAKYPFTGTTGKVSIVGNSRIIFNSSEWGLTISTPSIGTFPLEINLNSGATATMAVSATVTSLNVVAGTLNMASNTIALNNGSVLTGDVTIANGATISCSLSSGTGNIFQRSPTLLAGTLTVNGTLILTGASPTISMNSIVLNGTVQYSKSGTQTLAAGVNSGANPLTYNNLILSGSGAKTLAISTTINGTLSMQGTASVALGSATLTYGANGTLEYAGSSTQTVGVEWPSPTGGPNNIITNNSNGVTLGTSRTVNGTVTLKSDTFDAGGFGVLTISSTGSLIYNGGTITNFALPFQLNNFTLPTGTTTLPSDLTVTGTLTLGSDTLDIVGNTLTFGDFSTTTGVIKSDGTGNIVINGTGFLSNNLLFDQTTSGTTNRLTNLTINCGSSPSNGGATLGNRLELTGTLTLTNGTLNTGGTLTLVSNVTTTARVESIPTTADITGNVKVQRYITAVARQYRMLSPNTASFTYADLIDNMFVTGPGGATNGFDPTPTNSPSIYTYREDTSGIGRGWKVVSNITNSLSLGQGAMVFVRGDRTLPSPAWYTAPAFTSPNPVTADFNGGIGKGNISPSLTYTTTGDITSDGWNLVGNPYPSQIDWVTVGQANLDGNFWIIDPSSGSYFGSNSGVIASGQAFFVHAINPSPTISFNESNKISGAPTNYFKTANPKLTAKMVKDSVNSDLMSIEFAPGASWNFISTEDILKMYNSKINFGITTGNGIDVQKSVVPPLTAACDTIHLFAMSSSGSYTLNFSGQSSINSNYSILLKDNFTSTSQDLRSNPVYTFSINSNPASTGYNRFQIIFASITAMPVTILNISAHKSADRKSGIVNWETVSEKNVYQFIVERSIQNTNEFKEIGAIAAIGNSATPQQYNFEDPNIYVINSSIYYRLKIVDRNGDKIYSEIVSIQNELKSDAVVLYPNPVKDKIGITASSQLQGSLQVNVYNVVGKQLITKDIFASGNSSISVDVSDLKDGIYFISIKNISTGDHVTKMFTKD